MGCEIIVVGTSLGGLLALGALLENLPADFGLPLAVVQHRSVESEATLLRALRRHTALRLLEPLDQEPILPGSIYIAPADYHLLVERGAFRLSTEGPVHYARPSIDVLFESAADAYGNGTVGIVLTGANGDGARGASRIKEKGGLVVVQAPEEAECPVMPRAVLQVISVDYVLPLSGISSYLASLHAAA
jgi:two-component system, chemotaxis family, protein-glutamate methylesterase/glutaminase